MTYSFHKVYLTGATSYIGSHTLLELLNSRAGATVFKNFNNSHPLTLVCVVKITFKKLKLVQTKIIQDSAAFATALLSSGASEVVHFVGLK
jgi:UDP-glucose 4-epimerase